MWPINSRTTAEWRKKLKPRIWKQKMVLFHSWNSSENAESELVDEFTKLERQFAEIFPNSRKTLPAPPQAKASRYYEDKNKNSNRIFYGKHHASPRKIGTASSDRRGLKTPSSMVSGGATGSNYKVYGTTSLEETSSPSPSPVPSPKPAFRALSKLYGELTTNLPHRPQSAGSVLSPSARALALAQDAQSSAFDGSNYEIVRPASAGPCSPSPRARSLLRGPPREVLRPNSAGPKHREISSRQWNLEMPCVPNPVRHAGAWRSTALRVSSPTRWEEQLSTLELQGLVGRGSCDSFILNDDETTEEYRGYSPSAYHRYKNDSTPKSRPRSADYMRIYGGSDKESSKETIRPDTVPNASMLISGGQRGHVSPTPDNYFIPVKNNFLGPQDKTSKNSSPIPSSCVWLPNSNEKEKVVKIDPPTPGSYAACRTTGLERCMGNNITNTTYGQNIIHENDEKIHMNDLIQEVWEDSPLDAKEFIPGTIIAGPTSEERLFTESIVCSVDQRTTSKEITSRDEVLTVEVSFDQASLTPVPMEISSPRFSENDPRATVGYRYTETASSLEEDELFDLFPENQQLPSMDCIDEEGKETDQFTILSDNHELLILDEALQTNYTPSVSSLCHNISMESKNRKADQRCQL